MIKFLLFISIIVNLTANQAINIQEVTKDGIYLNIGIKDGVEEFTELEDKQKKIKLKIIKLSDSHSIACLIDKDGGCDYNIENMLKIKNQKFYIPGKDKESLISNSNTALQDTHNKKEEKVFVRNDPEKFENITKEQVDLFKNTNKVFDLIIFNHDKSKKDSDYRLSGAINFYTIGGFELKETDLNYINPILQADMSYEDDMQKFNLIFDANVFLQKKYTTKSFNLYQMSYEYKYNRFSFKVGRDNLSDLGDFYLTDGFFATYKNNNVKFGMITAFGIDYYDNMKTDFKHIYLGGYGKYETTFSTDYAYSGTIGFVPEVFNGSLGILPVYINNSFSYKESFNFDYQFKMSYSRLDTDKELYFNHYLTIYTKPVKDLKLVLGFDSREYLDLINYSYYETILEKIDSDKSKNIHSNISYKFSKDLLSFTYKRRINHGGSDEFSLRYFNYYLSPFEYSLRTTALFMKDVDIFIVNINTNYMFSNELMLNFDLFIMQEKVKIINDKAMGFVPQISLYKKFFSYFYLKGEAQFELRAKKIQGMIKIGYIFDTEMR